jgi:hypothetical protein
MFRPGLHQSPVDQPCAILPLLGCAVTSLLALRQSASLDRNPLNSVIFSQVARS